MSATATDQEESTQADARVPQLGQVPHALVLAAAVAATAATVGAEVEAADSRYRGEDLMHSAESERAQTEVEVEAKMQVLLVLLVNPCPARQNLAEEGMEGGRAHLADPEGMAGPPAGTRALGTREEVHCIYSVC